jgi:hypothetical protein
VVPLIDFENLVLDATASLPDQAMRPQRQRWR